MVTVLLTWRYPHCHEYFYPWQYAFLGVFFSGSFSCFRVYWPGWLGYRRKTIRTSRTLTSAYDDSIVVVINFSPVAYF